MADENGAETPAAAPEQKTPTLPKMQVLGQFIRDMSFENIAAQKAMQSDAQPEMNVQVGLDARKRDTEDMYDVIMKMKVESKTKEETPRQVFLLEMEYGGIFKIENISNEQLHPFLMIECPRMLFPFVRRIISDVTRDGGFPPVNLDSIDFLQLYRQQLAQQQAKKADA